MRIVRFCGLGLFVGFCSCISRSPCRRLFVDDGKPGLLLVEAWGMARGRCCSAYSKGSLSCCSLLTNGYGPGSTGCRCGSGGSFDC